MIIDKGWIQRVQVYFKNPLYWKLPIYLSTMDQSNWAQIRKFALAKFEDEEFKMEDWKDIRNYKDPETLLIVHQKSKRRKLGPNSLVPPQSLSMKQSHLHRSAHVPTSNVAITCNELHDEAKHI